MKRFEYNPDGFSSLDESTDGEWVRYQDHAADRAALVAQLEAAERAHEQALNERDAAHLALESSNTLLARTQDGIIPKAPERCMHDSGQLDHDVSRHLERAGFVWDALRRKWRAPGVESATWTEYRGREQ